MPVEWDPIARAIEEHVTDALLAVRPGLKIARENQKLTPPPKPQSDLWVRLLLQEASADHFLASRATSMFDFGLVVVECFAPLNLTAENNPSSPVRRLADDVRNIFLPNGQGLRVSAAGVTARFSYDGSAAPRVVYVGEVDDMGAWNKRLVIAPFRVEHL